MSDQVEFTVGVPACCMDEKCDKSTCIDLPEQLTCGDCAHASLCSTTYGGHDKNRYCRWFPRRFQVKRAEDSNGQ